MPAEEEINLYVTIHAGCPELHADLSLVPRRQRAERLRLLATLGLAGARTGGRADASPAAAAEPASAPADPQIARKVRLLGRLES
ncbi:MAG TPA: hypothetical protein VES73_02745 [Lamprocystis sp. (in: g-proteobacteria)]|nr:hypothetical protein [Lamprocystis sp. (in: g-proteobacteria)]